MPRSLAVFVGVVLMSAGTAVVARGDDYGVIISVAQLRTGKHSLSMAENNAELMRSAFDNIGINGPRLLMRKNQDVTVPAIRSLCLQLKDTLKSGDRLIIYFTGHGIAVPVVDVPTRAYFTYDTDAGPGGNWYQDTLLTDRQLADWLGEIKARGVQVIFFRECCFNGDGYSKELQEAGFVRAPPKPLSVGTVELSACQLGEAAHAVIVDNKEIGIFTQHLTRVLNEDRTRLTMDQLATEVERSVPKEHRGQDPERFPADANLFKSLVLIDRTVMSVIINTIDEITQKELPGVKVYLNDSLRGVTPLTLTQIQRQQRSIVPRLELEGYVGKLHGIQLEAKKNPQSVTITLQPEYAVIEGQLVETAGKPLDGVKVGWELTEQSDTPIRVFDSEVQPDITGRFKLKVATGFAYTVNVFAFAQANVLARAIINDRKPLESFQKLFRPYDAGTLKVTLPSEGPSPVELAFEKEFSEAQVAFDAKDYATAKRKVLVAKTGLDSIKDTTIRQPLNDRLQKLSAQVQAADKLQQCSQLVDQAKAADAAGQLEEAKSLVLKALELDPDYFVARMYRVDLEERIPRPKVETPTETTGADKGVVGETITRSGTVMVAVPAGDFTLGNTTSEGDQDESPPHRVHFARKFYIDMYEVTWERYRLFCNATNRPYPPDSDKLKDNWPVVNVTWQDAMDYAAYVGKKLPTEAQWEYAAKGNQDRKYPWGSDTSGDRANWASTERNEADWFNYLRPVGSTTGASWCGAMDMAGNVWEWCLDWYKHDAYALLRDGAESPQELRPSKDGHVIRGGSWLTKPASCRVTIRNAGNLPARFPYIGFRCVWEP
ncbi:MAG: SUMF1/EgtB/PvdO family nonheme iron enzyme [Planctomycetota bacterium]